MYRPPRRSLQNLCALCLLRVFALRISASVPALCLLSPAHRLDVFKALVTEIGVVQLGIVPTGSR